MQEVEEDIIKIQNTRGATSQGETEKAILEKSLGEVINAIIVFPIIIDNKNPLMTYLWKIKLKF